MGKKKKSAFFAFRGFVLRFCNRLRVTIIQNTDCRNGSAAGIAETDTAKQPFRRFQTGSGRKRKEG